jgi:hypothetical protein
MTMGDIIKKFEVRSEKTRRLRLYFDTGSLRTFVKESAARQLKGLMKLPRPDIFYGLGNGKFKATYGVRIEIKLLGIWVRHFCYVVPDEVLEPRYDILLGHDFMQAYDIRLLPKHQDIVVTKEALKMALTVRTVLNTC